MIKRIMTGIFVLLLWYVCLAYGDMGRILTGPADVREDSQKARAFLWKKITRE